MLPVESSKVNYDFRFDDFREVPLSKRKVVLKHYFMGNPTCCGEQDLFIKRAHIKTTAVATRPRIDHKALLEALAPLFGSECLVVSIPRKVSERMT